MPIIKEKKTDTHSKLKFEEDILKSPNTKTMKNSLIFKMEQTDQAIIKSKVSALMAKPIYSKEVLIQSSVPIPRDGHSCCMYKNKLVIFGGDRNKFQLNDLHMYWFE